MARFVLVKLVTCFGMHLGYFNHLKIVFFIRREDFCKKTYSSAKSMEELVANSKTWPCFWLLKLF